MALQPGITLGPYEILGPLGVGGMGEVYRARDTALGREVAIKVLPEDFAADPDRMARFEREAKLLASLNHPNIATLFGYSSDEGTHFLAMELVEGETLAERIARGSLSIEEALPLFLEIAEGIEAAHDKGVIHRDLKPANIKITDDDSSGGSRVKILDFGLAKAMVGEEASSAHDRSVSPTLTMAATQRGEILGTAAYMSPEQARGRPVDRRTDVWAFGVCLYETLTGRKVFEADDAPDTMAAVLRADLDWSALPVATPPPIRRLLRRCLERDVRERLHDIADARIELVEALADTGEAATAAPGGDRRRTAVPWALFGLAALALLVVLVVGSPEPPPERPLLRTFLTAPPDASVLLFNTVPDLAITPDGRRVVYLASVLDRLQIVVRHTTQLAGSVLAGTEDSLHPFVSPDGNWVGYQTGGQLKKVSIAGGPPAKICSLNGTLRGASWGLDDTIVFSTDARDGGLFRVSAGGGEPETLTTPNAEKNEFAHHWPQILPGGKAILFTVLNTPVGFEVAVLSLETGRWRTLLPGTYPRYVPTGHLVYAAGGALHAVPFDADRLEITGDPLPVLDNVVTKRTGAADFDVSREGSLVYVSSDTQTGSLAHLVWVDRNGREEPLEAPERTYVYPRISPDGRRVALDLRDQDNDVWTWDLQRKTLTRVTFDPGLDLHPIWSADGQRLFFSASRLGPLTLFSKAADGTGAAQPVVADGGLGVPLAATPDGKYLVWGHTGMTTDFDLMLLSLDGSAQIETLLATPFAESNAEVSPDGRWLAYGSNESGEDEVYVRPFPNIEDGKVQISSRGGVKPLWSRDGTELFYHPPDGNLMVVRVDTGEGFQASEPEPLLEGGQYYFGSTGRTFDVSPDGRRFLMLKPIGSGDEIAPARLVLVQNWFDELERLVPVD